jgi:hypothetical protein
VLATLDDALASTAQLGPFFTITPFAGRDSEQTWWPLDALPAKALTAQLKATSGFLGIGSQDEGRTIGSILHLGAAAALCSPLLAVAALEGYVPALTAAQVDVGYPAIGPLRVSLNGNPPSSAKPALLPELADQLIAVALDGLLEPFTAALTAIEPVPEQTLAGNAFSALAAAARLIEPPEAGRRARALVDLVARRAPLLIGAGDLHWQQSGSGHEYFRRRNCCLFYRIPGAGTCGDCVLNEQGLD